jgi:hypothetical protein
MREPHAGVLRARRRARAARAVNAPRNREMIGAIALSSQARASADTRYRLPDVVHVSCGCARIAQHVAQAVQGRCTSRPLGHIAAAVATKPVLRCAQRLRTVTDSGRQNAQNRAVWRCFNAEPARRRLGPSALAALPRASHASCIVDEHRHRGSSLVASRSRPHRSLPTLVDGACSKHETCP